MQQAAGSRQQAVKSAANNARAFVVTACCLLPAACFLAGCASFGPIRNPGTDAAPKYLPAQPQPTDLVRILNEKAAQISAIEADSVAIENKGGSPGQARLS